MGMHCNFRKFLFLLVLGVFALGVSQKALAWGFELPPADEDPCVVDPTLPECQPIGLGDDTGTDTSDPLALPFPTGFTNTGKEMHCDTVSAIRGGSASLSINGNTVTKLIPETLCTLYQVYDEYHVPLPEKQNLGSGKFSITVSWDIGNVVNLPEDPDKGHGNNCKKYDSDNPGSSKPFGEYCDGQSGVSCDVLTNVKTFAAFCENSTTVTGSITYIGDPASVPSWTGCSVSEAEAGACVKDLSDFPLDRKGNVDLASCALSFPAANGLAVGQVLSYQEKYSDSGCTGHVDYQVVRGRSCQSPGFNGSSDPCYVADDANGTDYYHTWASTAAPQGRLPSGVVSVYPQTINLKCDNNTGLDNGNIKATVLSGVDFDATRIAGLEPFDPSRAPTLAVGDSELATQIEKYSLADINGDGRLDVQLFYSSCKADGTGTAQIANGPPSLVNPDRTIDLRLVGFTTGGTAFVGNTNNNTTQ